MAQTIATIQHDDTKALEYKLKANSLIKEFSKVGRLNTMYSNNKRNIDIVDLMDALTPTAVNLFKVIKDNLNFKTNESTLHKPKSKVEQKRRSNATKPLKNLNAIKKTGQRSYIINPYLIVPPNDYQKDILAKWNSLP
jgi:hypothetical protein